MGKALSLFAVFLITFILSAQNEKNDLGKTFWKEDFSGEKLPEKWIIKAENDSNVVWTCTNQPFPGSDGFNQQAPPIASVSGGYHMQFAPGVKVDKNYRNWNKSGIWPDAFFQTNAINCSGKKSVVLKFAQNFRWNSRSGVRKDGGLYVGVSNNGTEWKEYEVRNGLSSRTECPNPMNIELNISSVAAMQKNVYLRFYWRGLYSWYWMVDDIELSEAPDLDVAALAMISHKESDNTFTKADIFSFKVVNESANDINKPFDCYLEIDNRLPIKVTVPFNVKKNFRIVDTVLVTFPPVDMTDYGIHNLRFYTALGGDVRKQNDTLSYELTAKAYALGPVTGFSATGSNFKFICNNARVLVDFYRDNLFRIQMSYNDKFTNPAGNDIVISTTDENVRVKYSEEQNYYLLSTPLISLRAYKNPLRFALYKSDNKTIIWEEARDLTYGKETIQYLKRGDDEYFYGGGMQNGRFSHRDKTILIRNGGGWDDGANPNPAPFYMSNKGYGALRNTFAPGSYSFSDTVKLIHSESRFDCYYFSGKSLKDILGAYTDLTGKPFLPPRWGLSLGDANCYNRGANLSNNTTGFKGTTPDVIHLIADQYINNNFPRGWILPNDGYGCGYTKLDSVVIELGKRGFHTGLWTENGVERIAREVGQYGTRLCKLDVAWVGRGYKFAMDACKAAYYGIEKNSDARGFIWSVCGWAGTQRNSVLWSGDQRGSWNYIRWHIPTVIGSGLSAINCASSDVDGIFNGSDKTYTRDLQWKCFIPVFMSMSGWAPKDKQPYIYGEPYTSINRKYLMLKMRLTPYMYTLCNEASETGVPAVRALLLEYPDDKVTWGTFTQYEFLLGKNILVAPVYRDEEKRDSIYLPEGKWFDYWNGNVFQGNNILNNYPAPLDKLPLFVKGGSIIPMYQQMYYDGERPADTLTLDIYPGKNAQFEMYEDDGSTRDYREGAYAKTKMKALTSPVNENKIEQVNIEAPKGNYLGKPGKRVYIFQIHSNEIPKQVSLQDKKLRKFNNENDFSKAKAGWYFNAKRLNGLIYIKTEYISTATIVLMKINY